jgi:hypothetical protein
MQITEDLIRITESDRRNLISSYSDILLSMNKPFGLTVNIHPTISVRNEKKHWLKKKVALTDIDALWGSFSTELKKMQFFSSERNRPIKTCLAFGNVEIGKTENLAHIHSVINNLLDCNPRIFRYLIKMAIDKASEKVRIMSGEPHITYSVDSGWVGYCFKGDYLHSLVA